MESQMTVIRIGFLFLLLMPGFVLKGQDVSFSQFYTNPLYLNPAFAGSVEVPRIAFQHRNQWHSFGDAFSTYSFAVDFPVKKLKGGVGFFLLNDAQAGNSYRSFEASAIYSVFVNLSENFRLHGAVQAGFKRNLLDINKLVFPDNVDSNYGNHGISGELEYFRGVDFSLADFSTGVLLYNQRFFGGLAAHHLAEPRLSFNSDSKDESNKLSRKYTAHIGFRLPVYLYGHHRKKFDISPQMVWQYQGSLGQMNYGLFATKWGLTAGTWFRQNFGLRYDAVILLAGFMKKNWQLTYTYDMAVSGLSGEAGGTSEISLVFLFREIDKGSFLPFYQSYEDDFGVQ
ncbi:MAG: PorP/SprF family type IX secretion system membrane protein [Bacteroidales bacterium]|nr:PorP/SprF family type IX secretion system membrane protein [Bacteroidales bacterium]